MKLRRITARNFKSLRGDFDFEFPAGPGLFLLRGDNRVDGALQGNGAGKSTLWDLLYWILEGKTPRGLRAGDVASWGVKKDVVGELTFEDDSGDVRVLRRTWGPISLTLDGADITKDEEAITQFVRVRGAAFLSTVLMAQAAPLFLDLPAEGKTRLLAEVLDLDLWLTYSVAATKRSSDADARARVLERKLAGLDGEIRGLEAQKDSGGAKVWEDTRSRRLAAIEAEHGGLAARVLALQTQITELQRDWNKARSAVKVCKESLLTLREASADFLDKTMAPALDAVRQAGWVTSRARADLKRVSDLGAGECPTCGTELTAANLDKHVEELKTKLNAAKDAEVKLQKVLDKHQVTSTSLQDNVVHCEKLLSVAEDELEARERALSKAEQEKGQLNKHLDRLEDEAAELEGQTNPHAEEAKARAAALQRARDDQRQASAALQVTEEERELASMWAKSFKDLRLQAMEDALQELEVEVAKSLGDLGLQDWAIWFEADRETAAGGVKRGFHVTVQSPSVDKPAPWEAWSGGEGQRLRVAGNMGLSDLVRTRKAVGLDLEVWDEPTTWLSPQGVVDLLDTLRDRAVREQRQVWVVDHRTLGYGYFDRTYTMIKTDAKSWVDERE